MPKKPSTCMVMQPHSPLSPRFWYTSIVLAVHRANRACVGFEFGVVGDDRQAGRTVVHNLPAILAPNSPLSRFLVDGFGIHLAERQPFDLATLVNRQFQARFDKGVQGRFQAIVAIRPFNGAVAQPGQVAAVPEQQEQTNGLG